MSPSHKHLTKLFLLWGLALASAVPFVGAQARPLRLLYKFQGIDGSEPGGTLLRDDAGNLYGTTEIGGDFNKGTVFKLAPDGVYTVLHAFAGGRDGMYPSGDLLRTRSGKLFGTTAGGGGKGDCGGSSCGTVYELEADGSEIILHRFAGSEGTNPVAGLIADQEGNLYGAALGGGDLGNGVVFTLKK